MQRLLCFVPLFACATAESTDEREIEQPFTSAVATLLDAEFSGELVTTSVANLRKQIKTQLLYSVGQLNAEPGVARLERLALSQITTASLGNGLYRVRYRAKLPVAWGHQTALPTSYELVLPKRIDTAGLTTFTSRYQTRCNDGDPNAVNVANFWYHYRPRAFGCALSAADVVRLPATLRISTQNTFATYPEYHRIWEDGRLDVLAVFGKYAVGATSTSDAGIAAYNSFLRSVRARWPDAVTTPASLPFNAAPAITDVTFSRTVDGETTQITALLVDEVKTAPASFDKRYSELTPGADLIIYNGHAGLGSNVRALAQKGRWFPGKYQIMFFNGCDTFAYVDDTLAQTRAALNPEDPSGTRYLDTISNAMPAYFHDLDPTTIALVTALGNPDQPKSYIRMFQDVDPVQVVVATGEEDNVFHQGFDPGTDWAGFAARGEVGYAQTLSFRTETLPPGRYTFHMTADPTLPNGDADLRIRVGAPPTITSTYRCKSYLYNSNERCTVTLTTPAQIYMTATGDVQRQSRFFVTGWQEPAQ